MSKLKGFWSNKQEHGPITGTGPNFAEALRAFERRQNEYRKVGTWRCQKGRLKNDGRFIDPDYYIVERD